MVDDQDRLYLMDFGLAGWVEEGHTRMTRDGAVMGTPAFMSPEQARGDTRQVGPASDLYSAGVVLFQLLTGRLPFEAPWPLVLAHVLQAAPPAPSTYCPGLDPELDALCLATLAKDPKDRPASAAAFADE